MQRADHGPKDRLREEAKRLFHERGYGKATLGQIARAAGMTAQDAGAYYGSLEEICHEVIETYRMAQAMQFEEISANGNPRQRLSLYLDSLADQADDLARCGCPITNLYFDVKREDRELADHAAELMLQRFNWIAEQFVIITRVETSRELPERLTSAIHGIGILAQVRGNARLIRNQVNQLKSWIRSM